MTAPPDPNVVAQYLADHPHFFDDHAALLGHIKLTNPQTGRTVSLQERQLQVMRDKYKTLEMRMAELIRTAQDNATIANKFHAWTVSLLHARYNADLARIVIDGLIEHFSVPHATLRLWGLDQQYAARWFAQGVSDDAKIFANSLLAPYCGSNHDFEAVRWLDGEHATESTVIIPLHTHDGVTFGLLILGSPDPQRFTAQMATDFLMPGKSR